MKSTFTTKLGVFQGLAGQWITVFTDKDGNCFKDDRGFVWPIKKQLALDLIADQKAADAKRKAWLLNRAKA